MVVGVVVSSIISREPDHSTPFQPLMLDTHVLHIRWLRGSSGRRGTAYAHASASYAVVRLLGFHLGVASCQLASY